MTHKPGNGPLRQLPTKWAVAIVVALIGYALLQPLANKQLGWSLPSIGSMLGQEPAQKPLPRDDSSQLAGNRNSTNKPDELAQNSSEDTSDPNIDLPQSNQDSSNKTQSGNNSTATNSTKTNSSSKSTTSSDSTSSKPNSTKPSAAESKLLYGLLKDLGRENYVSPEGLHYSRGSAEGHRLKHLERHLSDMPDRPGKHGVFDGDMAQALRWIDDAYARGKQGAKGVKKRTEDGSTVYEVPFSKPIGYVGGRDGKRDRNPDASRLRLVVRDDEFVTAFPF